MFRVVPAWTPLPAVNGLFAVMTEKTCFSDVAGVF